MPNGSNRSLWGNTLGLISSGLPNIVGNMNESINATTNGDTTSTDGAFSWIKGGYKTVTSNISTNNYKLHFDASKSNSIYGTTTYVRPQSIGVKFVIKY